MTQVPAWTFGADPSGSEALDQIEAMLAALRSHERGAVAPSNPVPGMVWNDTSTTPPVWRVRTDNNAGWDMLQAQLLRGVGAVIVGVHTVTREVAYTRATRSNAAFGAEILITPKSTTSKLFITGAHRCGMAQTGGDDDASAAIDLAVKKADGSFVPLSASDGGAIYVINAGVNPSVGAVSPVSGWISDRYAGKFVLSAWGGVSAGDSTVGYAGTVTSSAVALTCLEIEGL